MFFVTDLHCTIHSLAWRAQRTGSDRATKVISPLYSLWAVRYVPRTIQFAFGERSQVISWPRFRMQMDLLTGTRYA